MLPRKNEGLQCAHAPKERGLSPDFPTMAEIYRADGYKTGIFGKWHLGDQEDTRPHQRGFDVSSGLMYSNDMWEHHPENPEFWGKFPLQYWKNGQVEIEALSKADQRNLTKWATDDAVNFINDHAIPALFFYTFPIQCPMSRCFVVKPLRVSQEWGFMGMSL